MEKKGRRGQVEGRIGETVGGGLVEEQIEIFGLRVAKV